MTSVGSVSIDLTLNRSQFDNDLRKLEQENLGAIALSTRLDPTDFERQIKGLTGFLPAVSIPVELDSTRLQQQLSQLGNGSVSIALKCDRRSFNRDLQQLQQENLGDLVFSPKLDTSDIKRQVNELNSLFTDKVKPIPVRLELDTKDFDRQIQGLQGFIPTISVPIELDTRKINLYIAPGNLNVNSVTKCNWTYSFKVE